MVSITSKVFLRRGCMSQEDKMFSDTDVGGEGAQMISVSGKFY